MKLRSRQLRLILAGLAGATTFASSVTAEVTEKPAWDQVANIKDAAARLGQLHRARGAKGAYDFIDACYRTHSLAENYGAAFESCIAQDYLETKVLAQVYARMPPDVLQKLGAPSPQLLAESMGRRIVAAFAHYKVGTVYAEDLKKLVDEHGFPIFLKIIFPEAAQEMEDKASKKRKPQ